MKSIYTYLNKLLRGMVVLSILLCSTLSCNEKEFLQEIPLSFYSPENSYITFEDFEAAIYHLHNRFRVEFYDRTSQLTPPMIFHHGTDFGLSPSALGVDVDYGSLLDPTASHVYDAIWRPAYNIIYDANVIIDRSVSELSELTAQEALLIEGEARFFRGLSYKMLANLHGGVPIILEEVKSPKRDYIRASRNNVYEQAAEDLRFAADNLPDIDHVDGSKINRLAALHVLSEVYISLEKWTDAIEVTTQVIDHPNMGLMTERFGSRSNEPGDVFWDLFRQGNQNREIGNREAIWVQQWEYNVPGGGPGGPRWIRFFVPRYWQAKVANNDGGTVPIVPLPNTYWHGRGGGLIRATNHFYYTIWEESGWSSDIRNSEYNMIRDIRVNNEASDHNGQWVIKDNLPLSLSAQSDTLRDWFPATSAKCSDPGNHPREIWLNANGDLPSAPQSYVTYRNEYTIRLPETYLLRAEAYLGLGDLTNAAEDINVVRRRAQAPEIASSNVDIDYILDERLRELHIEEFRLLTLTRLGKLVERARQYNHIGGNTYFDHNNLWPIPFSEIEKNIEGEITQNANY